MLGPLTDLRAVLFDLDGTLVETHIDFPAMTRAMRDMAHKAGIADSAIAGQDILGIVAVVANEIQAHGGDGIAFISEAHAKLQAMEVLGCASPNLLPGSDTLLARLVSAGTRVGIVTRNCRAVSVCLLARFALPHHLLLTRDDVTRAKPHPDHLWDALRLLACPPSDAAMVGDHPMDIQAGRAAGCRLTRSPSVRPRRHSPRTR